MGATKGSLYIQVIQTKFYMILPYLPNGAVSSFDFFLMHLTQGVVAFMKKEDKIKCARIIGVLDNGIPMLNHLGRSKFLKVCSSFLMGFNRGVYGTWCYGNNCYPD